MDDLVSYDPEEEVVYFTAKDQPKEIHNGVSPREFEQIEKIESYSLKCMSTPDRLLNILNKGSIFSGAAMDDLESLKKDVIDLYTEFPSYKYLVEDSKYDKVRGYDGVIYKVKRPLEHVFECIGIVADLITNGRLLRRFHLNEYGSYHIQHLIINTCAVLEHLGIVAVNRLVSDDGGIDPTDPQYNVTKVYELILDEGLHDPLREDDDLIEDISLSEVDKVKQMRDRFAHKSVYQHASSQQIPEGLEEQAYLYDRSDIRELINISVGLQTIAVSVLIKYIHDHAKTGIKPYVDAVYQSDEGEDAGAK